MRKCRKEKLANQREKFRLDARLRLIGQRRRLNEALELRIRQTNKFAVSPGIEGDLLVFSQRSRDENFHAVEIAEWRHRTGLAVRERVLTSFLIAHFEDFDVQLATGIELADKVLEASRPYVQ